MTPQKAPERIQVHVCAVDGEWDAAPWRCEHGKTVPVSYVLEAHLADVKAERERYKNLVADRYRRPMVSEKGNPVASAYQIGYDDARREMAALEAAGDDALRSLRAGRNRDEAIEYLRAALGSRTRARWCQ
jgi:hypothetical protein